MTRKLLPLLPLLLLLGCEELGNPQGTVWNDVGLGLLGTEYQSVPMSEAQPFVSQINPASLSHLDSTAPNTVAVCLVRVRARWRASALPRRLTLATDFHMADGSVVRRAWTVASKHGQWAGVFSLQGPPIRVETNLVL